MSRVVFALLVFAACSSPDATPPPSAIATPTATKRATAPTGDGYDPESLGALTFPVPEGTPEARAHFARGLLALHSFWYDEAIRQFQAAIDADHTMRMAYWGAAMSQFKLLWGDDDLGAAGQILSRMPDPDSLPPREMAWVNATLELLQESDVRSSRKRFATAMEAVHSQFPDDESATFLAIALLASTRPDDPDNRKVRERAGELALGVFQHNPKHPGAAHYLIHAFDTPALAPRALPMARAYAAIAPSAFHARHMPAHIFSRLGMWKEAIASCQAAWDVSVAAARREKLSADHHDFHSLNWLIEMQFELGHRKDADAALETFAHAVRGGLGHQARGLYATQVASYMQRTGDWSRIDDLLAPLATPAVEDPMPGGRASEPAGHCSPTTTASPPALLEHLSELDARSRAAAMQHDLIKTKQLVADLAAMQARLRPYLEATEAKPAVAKIEETRARRQRALIAIASNDDKTLLKIWRDSIADADLEEANSESIHSGFLVHEEIGDLLMRLDHPKEAAVEYALTLGQHPGRAHSLLGAARASARAGDQPAALARYQQLVQLWITADPGTEGLAEAKAAIAAGH